MKIFFFVFFILLFKNKKKLTFKNLNFRNLDFTNHRQIKSFIFKKNFHNLKNKYVQNFDFLNFSKKLGGKIGINLSKKTIFDWYSINRNKINYPWIEDLSSKRLINLLYNYEYIASSSDIKETLLLDKIILTHIYRVNFEFKQKKIYEVSAYDLVAYLLTCILLKKMNPNRVQQILFIVSKQIDKLGMHKSYNLLEHSKFINNLNEIKNIFLMFKIDRVNDINEMILKMTSILIQYFHDDATMPLFNGSNNNYTKIIYENLNNNIYYKNREFINSKNGIAFYSDKKKKFFFDVVQPNKDKISSNLSAGTLSFEFSGLGEKIITNCGASETFGKNPEYLRYSAAHSTIVLQNTNISEIKENNPHIKYPQSVLFNKENKDEYEIYEGSHNGYVSKFNKIIKRKFIVFKNINKIIGEDSIIAIKKNNHDIIFHNRFHLNSGMVLNFTNNKKSVIIKTKLSNIWVFKSDTELVVEDSILVDNNSTKLTKQIVIKGIVKENKIVRRWSLEKI